MKTHSGFNTVGILIFLGLTRIAVSGLIVLTVREAAESLANRVTFSNAVLLALDRFIVIVLVCFYLLAEFLLAMVAAF